MMQQEIKHSSLFLQHAIFFFLLNASKKHYFVTKLNDIIMLCGTISLKGAVKAVLLIRRHFESERK